MEDEQSKSFDTISNLKLGSILYSIDVPKMDIIEHKVVDILKVHNSKDELVDTIYVLDREFEDNLQHNSLKLRLSLNISLWVDPKKPIEMLVIQRRIDLYNRFNLEIV